MTSVAKRQLRSVRCAPTLTVRSIVKACSSSPSWMESCPAVNTTPAGPIRWSPGRFVNMCPPRGPGPCLLPPLWSLTPEEPVLRLLPSLPLLAKLGPPGRSLLLVSTSTQRLPPRASSPPAGLTSQTVLKGKGFPPPPPPRTRERTARWRTGRCVG